MNSLDKMYYVGAFENNLNWNAEVETIKYLKNDCVCLFKILSGFLHKVSEEYNIDGTKIVSLPSLAMTVFRTNFLSDPNSTGSAGSADLSP